MKQFLSSKRMDFLCEKIHLLRRLELFYLYHEYENNQIFGTQFSNPSYFSISKTRLSERKNICHFPTTFHCFLGKSEIKQPKSCLSSVDLSLWWQRLLGKRKFDLNSFFDILFKFIFVPTTNPLKTFKNPKSCTPRKEFLHSSLGRPYRTPLWTQESLRLTFLLQFC